MTAYILILCIANALGQPDCRESRGAYLDAQFATEAACIAERNRIRREYKHLAPVCRPAAAKRV